MSKCLHSINTLNYTKEKRNVSQTDRHLVKSANSVNSTKAAGRRVNSEANKKLPISSNYSNFLSLNSVEDEFRYHRGKIYTVFTTKNALKRNIIRQESNPLLQEIKESQILNMDGTNAKQFPVFSSKSYIRSINFDNNHISELPVLINLDNLEVLKICNNLIKEIPSTIKNLYALKELHLNRNLIFNIPNEISELKELSVLSLNLNKITEVPECIEKLHKLRILELQRNVISRLPTIIGKMQFLEKLAIEWHCYSSNLNKNAFEDNDLRKFKLLCINAMNQQKYITFLQFIKEEINITDGNLHKHIIDVERNRNILHVASAFNHSAIAQSIIPLFHSVNDVDIEGNSPLILALLCRSESIAICLLQKEGVNVNVPHSKYGCPLNIAILNDLYISAYKILCMENVDLSLKDSCGNTALHLAMKKFDSSKDIMGKICDLIIFKHKAKLNQPNRKNYSPCMLASKKNQTSAIMYMINFNQNNKGKRSTFNLKKRGGKQQMSMLHYAVYFSNLTVIRLLIKEDLSIFELDNANMKPIHHSFEFRIKKYMLKLEAAHYLPKYNQNYNLKKCTYNINFNSRNSLEMPNAFADISSESCFMDNYDMQEGDKNTRIMPLYSEILVEANSNYYNAIIRPPDRKFKFIKATAAEPTPRLIINAYIDNNSLQKVKKKLFIDPTFSCESKVLSHDLSMLSAKSSIRVSYGEQYLLNSKNKQLYQSSLDEQFSHKRYSSIYSLFIEVDEIALFQIFSKLDDGLIIKSDIGYLISLLNLTKIKEIRAWSKYSLMESLNNLESSNYGILKYAKLFILEHSKEKNRNGHNDIFM